MPKFRQKCIFLRYVTFIRHFWIPAPKAQEIFFAPETAPAEAYSGKGVGIFTLKNTLAQGNCNLGRLPIQIIDLHQPFMRKETSERLASQTGCHGLARPSHIPKYSPLCLLGSWEMLLTTWGTVELWNCGTAVQRGG